MGKAVWGCGIAYTLMEKDQCNDDLQAKDCYKSKPASPPPVQPPEVLPRFSTRGSQPHYGGLLAANGQMPNPTQLRP
jgi:hypothetical protein